MVKISLCPPKYMVHLKYDYVIKKEENGLI